MNRSPTLAVGAILCLLMGLVIGGLARPAVRPPPTTDPRAQVAAMVKQMADGTAPSSAQNDDNVTRMLVKETLIQEILIDPELRKKAGGAKAAATMKGLLKDGRKLSAIETALANDPDAVRQMANEILVRQSLEDDTVAEQAQQALLQQAMQPKGPPGR